MEFDELRRGPLCESFERQELLGGHVEQVGRLGDIAEVEQLIDDRGAEAFDVHRAARREMDEVLAPLRRTEWVDAAPDHLPRLTDQE